MKPRYRKGFIFESLRGQEQLIRAIEDIKRGIELGVKNFVIYDEGLLWILGKMRVAHELPDYKHSSTILEQKLMS
ncbi:MAG: hypothetical protein RLP97_06100 [Coleofasciculus chthonoplastes F2-STO-03]